MGNEKLITNLCRGGWKFAISSQKSLLIQAFSWKFKCLGAEDLLAAGAFVSAS